MKQSLKVKVLETTLLGRLSIQTEFLRKSPKWPCSSKTQENINTIRKVLANPKIIYLADTLISLSVESSTACGVGGWLVVHHSCPHPSYPAFVSKGYPSPSPYLPLVHSFEPPSGYYAPIFPLSKAIFNLFLLYPIVQYTSFLPPDFHVKVLPYS